MHIPKLGVNIDHVATVRQARRTFEPDPVTAAALATMGGAILGAMKHPISLARFTV